MLFWAEQFLVTAISAELHFGVMGCSCSKSALEPRRPPGLPTLLGAVPKHSRESSDPKGDKHVEKAQEAERVEVSCHASAGAKWHLELLAVSAELKQKLQDPQFVATRCDLDGSGDLDAHELKQAARVYGVSHSGSSGNYHGHTNPRPLMAGQQRVSKESFAEMVASQQGSTKLIRTVPHSLRGMALGQLQHLETLFIKTGWLSARCESFNAKNSHAIANGTKFRQDTNLYALDTFVVTPMSKPGICGAREHDEQQTIAEANGFSSFSQLVNPFGLFVHCFVSHFWGHDFASTVAALDLWAQTNHRKMTSEKQALVYWICVFALNQHDVVEEVGTNPQQGPFNAALAQATGGAVMILDEEVKPLSRMWCLFEASRLKDLQRPFELICSEGSLSKPENGGQWVVSAKMLEATCQALWNVSAAKAQSSVAADKYQIWEETANESIRGTIKGVGAELWFNTFTDQNGADALAGVFSNFDRYMKSLLSTTVLEILLARGDCASAATCCLHGAHVSSDQLAQIFNSYLEETARRTWLNSMLLQASNASMAKLLLEHGADVEAAQTDGGTALMCAAQGGHEAVANLLIQHGADVRAASS
eukprot:s254_g36.t1